jgi:hypothetical protein
MKAIVYSAGLLLLAACTQPAKNTTTQDTSATDSVTTTTTTASSPSDQCYQRLEGTAMQDTTLLHLTLDGNTAKGELTWTPAEKDSRTGVIKGTRNGDIIKGVWVYIQEGMTDSLPVEFKLEGNHIVRKTYEYDQATGRQFLGANSKFEEEFTPVKCK